MAALAQWQLRLPQDDASDGEVRLLLIVLGLPTFALAFALSILTTYGPVVLLDITHSPALVGLLLGGEGTLALIVPLLSGGLSDRLPAHARLGKRLPFVLVGGPLLLVGIVLLPLVDSLLLAAVSLLLFFIGYYLYYPPYRAIYADLLPRKLYARSQASQGLLRGLGLAVALLVGGLLLGIGQDLPFVVAGALVAASTLLLRPVVRLQLEADPTEARASVSLRSLAGHRGLRLFAAANVLLELGFAGLRTFIVLYVTKGLGRSPGVASAVIGVVAVAYIIGAPLAARLEKRYDIVSVMTVSAALYGVGLCAGAVPTSLTPELILLPFVALAGSVLLTLPQALAFLVAPEGSEGAAAGIIDVSRGLGVVLGPLLVGYAVRYSSSIFSATHGYAAMWPVIGLATLGAVPLLRMIEVEE